MSRVVGKLVQKVSIVSIIEKQIKIISAISKLLFYNHINTEYSIRFITLMVWINKVSKLTKFS